MDAPRVLVFVIALTSCGRSEPGASVAPEPAPAADVAEATDETLFETQTFVSTAHNDTTRAPTEGEAAPTSEGFTVLTPAAAKELADAAVADQLDRKKSWKLSPVLPSAWPATEPEVVVFFYPMAANPGSLTHYQLFTPAFRVTVGLADGATEVHALGKRRQLGTIEDTRPTSLERRELELAESALIEQLIGTNRGAGENPYWGYLKYIHEHPKLGHDLERRAPAFLGWVRKKVGK